jgi:hypothetical protein
MSREVSVVMTKKLKVDCPDDCPYLVAVKQGLEYFGRPVDLTDYECSIDDMDDCQQVQLFVQSVDCDDFGVGV